MNIARYAMTGALAGTLLAGCVQAPTGPSVAVMPAPGKPFEVFAADEQACRNYATQSTGTPAADAANRNAAASAIAGTAIGATVGALAGGSRGVGTGAAIGLVGGAAVGSSQANYSGYSLQRRYDIAYQQCMYAKGNQLPGYYPPPVRTYRYTPPPSYYPPAGAGYPPPNYPPPAP